MRIMLDALYPDAIPLSANPQIIAAYKHHPRNVNSYAQAVARFPRAIPVSITPDPHINDCQVLDCEPTDATPGDCPAWVQLRRAAGIEPTIYCNQLNNVNGLPAVRAAFAAAHVPEPCYWVAKYDGIAVIPTGTYAKQYANAPMTGLSADASAVLDYWPTIDPKPIPTPQGDKDMYLLSDPIPGDDPGKAWYSTDGLVTLENISPTELTWLVGNGIQQIAENVPQIDSLVAAMNAERASRGWTLYARGTDGVYRAAALPASPSSVPTTISIPAGSIPAEISWSEFPAK